MWVILIPNKYIFWLILNSYVCGISIPKLNVLLIPPPPTRPQDLCQDKAMYLLCPYAGLWLARVPKEQSQLARIRPKNASKFTWMGTP
jgi:hypothetical protein